MSARRCSIDGCDRKHYARGWCEAHYQRWKKHGHAVALIPINIAPAALNARATHCKRGHEFNSTNTYASNGRRHCRICRTETERLARAKRKGAA